MKTAVVVSSCDQFRDAWAPFFYFFAKHWPDCPYPVYLVTNHGIYRDSQVTCIPVGRDRGWSDNLSLVLGRIGAQYIIYLQEDYFFLRAARTAQLQSDIELVQRNNIPYLGLYPSAASDEQPFNPEPRFNVLPPSSPMRASLQAAIWETKSLQTLLRPGETGWDMEKLGTERSRSMLFLRVRSCEASPIDYFCTAIKRGAWEPGAVEMCQQEKIPLDLNFRPVRPETKWQRFHHKWGNRLTAVRQRILPRHYEIIALPR